ncbi:MAG: SDR family NAD(P)-dependent oxidoreductase [Alphaproteobacteria bacterium]|nr:MAG: SDR family NAD(P)-dependent oxidoreductase [Alphaproteobacteria bacterium]
MTEDELLAGRVAVVTGAASGMGRVMARALAGAGDKIAGVDVDAAGLDSLAAEPALAGKFLHTITDVSKTAECRPSGWACKLFSAEEVMEAGWSRIFSNRGTAISSVPSACSARRRHWLASSPNRFLVPEVYAASAHCWHFSAFARYRSDRDDIESPLVPFGYEQNDFPC